MTDFVPHGPGGDREAAESESGDKLMPLWKRLPLYLVRIAMLLFFAPAFLIILYALVPPPATPLMLIRVAEGHGITKQWQPLERISPHLQKAVIAAEDAKFCTHGGFDWEAVDSAIKRYRGRGRTVGASTISMQTAKNLFLWPGRTFIRKGGEAYITVWLEALLDKKRILELYLNVIEFGPGIYGAEAAARHYYGTTAAQLNARQAAELASILPSPLRWQPGDRSHARTIEARMRDIALGNDAPCQVLSQNVTDPF